MINTVFLNWNRPICLFNKYLLKYSDGSGTVLGAEDTPVNKADLVLPS